MLLAVNLAAAARADYPSAVTADGPDAFYRLNDSLVRGTVNANIGSLGAAGNAINDLPTGVVRSLPGAIVGDPSRSSFFDFTTRTEIPFSAAVNRPADQPFTIEGWFLPSSDQTATGMGTMANRWTQGGPRQGWVMYQRKPDADHGGSEPVGWEFRMYDGVSTSTALDVVSLTPYTVGKWQHVVVVYDPVGAGAVGSKLSIYIDGVLANESEWSNADKPGYAPCTDNHDPAQAVNGQPALALGNYNNTNSGFMGAANPWFGGIDEFAFYPAKLTAAQILAHYQNGTNAARATSYSALVQSHSPSVYLRLGEIAPGADAAVNVGDLRAAGNGAYTPEARHPAPSALAGRGDDGSAAFHSRNTVSQNVPLSIPFSEANNPNAGTPFTFEAWLKPTRDQQGGQAPVNNRMVGGTGRTGWVIFQRNPNLTYPSSEGHGWNFRMYSGNGSGGQDVLTDTDYTVGRWQHLVVTWEPQTQNGDVGGNGNDQWEGILTAYVDGVQVAQNPNALYSANRAVPEEGQGNPAGTPVDLGVGAYNIASKGGNSYEGGVDELAIYNNYVLKADQILAHYQAGTNAHPATPYETLVYTAAFDAANPPDQTKERATLPATYLRFNENAVYPAANSGTLGTAADGSLVVSPNDAVGPVTTGFSANNAAVHIGHRNWVSLNNPSGLNIAGKITLEAWVNPEAVQDGPVSRIISHGPALQTDIVDAAGKGVELFGSLLSANEVSLRIENSSEYVVGSSDGTNFHGVRAPVGTDLGAGKWVHLVGTYDGTTWRLYRNGTEIANAADATGALGVADGDWAIGSTGSGWADNFAGGIDEAAIYKKSLTAAQVKAHYDAATVVPVSKITFERSANGLKLSWTGGVLQQSDAYGSGYGDVTDAVSPYPVSASGTAKFFRLRQ